MAHQTYVVQYKSKGRWIGREKTTSFNRAKSHLCGALAGKKQKRVVRIDSRTGSETLIRMTCKR